ncbi:hypothetical protein [Streptomyces sp. NPDC002133]|uniref:hypothetical protein n=1 Tax=Streptomyces sp. NPDC002133 TaxID=3154409 RepID=UPI003333F6CF
MIDEVRVPEYLEEAELTAGEELADDPAFWLAHLWISAAEVEEVTDVGDLEEMLDRLSDADAPWPVLRVPFGRGHTAMVVFRTFEDEGGGVDYFIHHPEWGRLGHLGQYDADPTGPGLSWSELTAIAAADADGGAGLTDPAQRLLLLLPMLGDADTPDEAVEVVERALVSCGIPAATAPQLAEVLRKHHLADGPRWVRTDASPIAVCTDGFGPRTIPLAQGITDAQTRTLADVLAGRTQSVGAADAR